MHIRLCHQVHHISGFEKRVRSLFMTTLKFQNHFLTRIYYKKAYVIIAMMICWFFFFKQMSSNHTPAPIQSHFHVIILTHPQNFKKREDQRKWLLSLPKNYTYTYISANIESVSWSSEEEKQRFVQETETYNDFAFANHLKEEYRSIGEKVFWGLDYATKLPSKPRYIAKTDDDIIVKTHILYQVFDNRPKNERDFYWGFIYYGNKPVRDVKNKWYVSFDEFEGEEYPPYACGPFYTMSYDVALRVAKKSHEPGFKVFSMEDVQMGMIVNDMDIKPLNNNGTFYCARMYSKDPENEMFIHG